MPITLQKIASNTAQITMAWGDDTVNLTYYPARITEKVYAQLQSFGDMEDQTLDAAFTGFNETLAHLIKSWDVYEDDAQTQMFPLDPQRFGELPISFRVDVMNAVLGDIRPNSVAPQSTLK